MLIATCHNPFRDFRDEIVERDGIRYRVPAWPSRYRGYDKHEWHYATPEDEAKAAAKYGPPPVVSAVNPLLRRVANVAAFAARGGRKD